MEYIENLILWTLALYGTFEIVKAIIQWLLMKKRKYMNTYIVITVKDGEEYIEGLLRSIMFKVLYGGEEYIKQILVVDLNSQDKTKSIIEKIEKDNDFVKLVDWEDCKNIVNTNV